MQLHERTVSWERLYVVHSQDFRSVGVGASSRTVRCGPCAGPTFHSCPSGTGVVQLLGGGRGNDPDLPLFRPDISPVGTDRARVMRCRRSLVLAAGCCCCCRRCCQLRSGRLCPAAPGVRLVTVRTVEGMAPYPGQARCLALGFWPECFRRLNVKGGQRPFPEETRSALDIEG